ncbi:MAG: choice-of-anchor D domain-containing protein [Anaerolineaceae bacterium]|nr:choice-of-anchor D domain-containing protein [Anaerolineaceae bacterium]
MKNICNHALTCLTTTLLVIIFASQTWATTLESGVPFNSSLNSMTYMNVNIVVPDGATGMTVSITNGSGDLDLYLKYGSPISGSTIAELKADADIITVGTGADETISITTASTPVLRAGTWYVTTLNLNAKNTSFTITATIYTVDYTVAFGSVEVGQTAQKPITITNSSTSDQIITAVNIAGLDAARFGATPNCPTIPAGGSHAIEITFQPISPGPASAQLIITSSGQMSSVLTIALTGTGTGAVTGEVLPLPTDKTNYPAYPPIITAETSISPATCKPIGVGDVGTGGDTVAIEIKLENPSGPYDTYLALQAPAIDPNEFFMLGQDGIFHPFSQSGLVKWKQSATGEIDEKPFGEFPASLLPGGAYNFNFMLTAAGSLDAYYLWQASFFAPETAITVPDGSAGFFNGTLVAPNATILSGGQLYENSAPAAKDELTAIKKDGKIYLYHPALDQAELSEDNTKLAVAYFMTGLSTSEINAVKEQMKRDAARTQTGTTMSRSTTTAEFPIPMLSNVGEVVDLDTGVKITLKTDKGLIEAQNNRKRFAMVKTSTANKNKYLLLPKASLIPTELLEAYYYYESGGETRTDIDAFDKIETFGAFVRLSEKAREKKFTEDQQKAIEKDVSLVISLNNIDMSYFMLEGIRQVAGIVIPTTCAVTAINAITRSVQIGLTELFIGDSDAEWQLGKSAWQGFCSNLIECCIQAAALSTVAGAIGIEAVDKFMSIVSLAQFTGEEKIESLLIYLGYAKAYDLAMLAPNDIIAYIILDKPSKTLTDMVWDLKETTIWKGLTSTTNHWNKAITPDGVVLSYWENEDGDQIITKTNWGTGTSINICTACGLKKDSTDPENVAITNAGRIFFSGEICWKVWNPQLELYSEQCDTGIYTSMADGSGCQILPVSLDQMEYNLGEGHARVRDINSLNVSRDGKVLVFSACVDSRNHLYAVDPTGNNLRVIATSAMPIDSIKISSNGNKILFDYTPTSGSYSAVPCVVSPNGGNLKQLSTPPSWEEYIAAENAAISPDGSWIAYPKGILSENSQMGIAFIRSDGSDYHWVNLGDLGVIPGPTISFLANGKSIIFTGAVAMQNDSQLDLYLLNVDKDRPNLRNLTNTPDKDEICPVVVWE